MRNFIKKVSTLASGTAFSQMIPLLISPILTRLYTPEEFGELALYVGFFSVLAIFYTLRYELAIMVADNLNEINLLVKLCFKVALFFLLISFFFLAFFWRFITDFNAVRSEAWIILPISAFSLAAYNVYVNVGVSKELYRGIAVNRAMQSLTNGVGAIGFSGLGFNGLILAGVFSSIFSAVNMKRMVCKDAEGGRGEPKKDKRVRDVLIKYIDFPKKTLPSSLVNAAFNHGKILSVAMLFSSLVAGYFSLAFRVVVTPLSAISSSLASVMFKETAELYRDNKFSELGKMLRKVLLFLSIAGVFPCLALWVYGEAIFTKVFGDNWAAAGGYASMMSFGFYCLFVGSPFCNIFYVFKKNALYLWWELSRAIIFFSILGVLWVKGENPEIIAMGMGVAMALSYIALIVLVFYVVSRELRHERNI